MNIATSEVAELLGPHREKLPFHQRAYGPRWLTSELVAGDGRPKLRAWLRDAPPPPWPEDADVADVCERIDFSGDAAALSFTAAVVATLPPPTRDYVISSASFVGLLTWAGFCGGPRKLSSRPWFVAVSPGAVVDGSTEGTIERFRAVVAHEVAHLWLEVEAPSSEQWMTSQNQALLNSPPFSMDTLEAVNPKASEALRQWQIEQRKREELVEALALTWGYRPIQE